MGSVIFEMGQDEVGVDATEATVEETLSDEGGEDNGNSSKRTDAEQSKTYFFPSIFWRSNSRKTKPLVGTNSKLDSIQTAGAVGTTTTPASETRQALDASLATGKLPPNTSAGEEGQQPRRELSIAKQVEDTTTALLLGSMCM